MLSVLASCQRIELFPVVSEILVNLRSFGDLKYFFSKQDYIKLVFSVHMFLHKIKSNYSVFFQKYLSSADTVALTQSGTLLDSDMAQLR